MDPRGRGPADQQGHREALPLHLARDETHLLQRRRDQSAEADGVDLFPGGGFQDPVTGHHHAEVDHVVVVTLEDHADNVLADVVHIPLDGGHEDLALGSRVAGGGFGCLEVRNQMGHCPLHDAGALDHLRQKHLARTEQVAHDIHPRHQRALDHLDRVASQLSGLLGVGLDVVGDPLYQCMGQALRHRLLPPAQVLSARRSLALHTTGHFHEPLGGIRPAVLNHIFDAFQ
jgi:hypothetical protein